MFSHKDKNYESESFFDIVAKIEWEDLKEQLKDGNKLENQHDFQKELDASKKTIETMYRNETFDKVRKYKIIYFLYGLWLNRIYDQYKNKEEARENINYKGHYFFKKKYTWSAFKQGPIIKDTYKWGKKDEDILIAWNEWDPFEKEFFKTGWKVLNLYNNEELINESHETDPWKNNWKETSYYKEIPTIEIEQWFSKNLPTFFEVEKN